MSASTPRKWLCISCTLLVIGYFRLLPFEPSPWLPFSIYAVSLFFSYFWLPFILLPGLSSPTFHAKEAEAGNPSFQWLTSASWGTLATFAACVTHHYLKIVVYPDRDTLSEALWLATSIGILHGGFFGLVLGAPVGFLLHRHYGIKLNTRVMRITLPVAALAATLFIIKAYGVLGVALAPYKDSERYSFGRKPIEGYSDRMLYENSDSIRLHIHSQTPNAVVSMERIKAHGHDLIKAFPVHGLTQQPASRNASANGAGWPVALTTSIQETLNSGYYRANIQAGEHKFPVHFLVRDKKQNARIAVFANASTWTAYNPWGGMSLYVNSHGASHNHTVSTLRPNLAFQDHAKKHDLSIEAHIFNWIDSAYGCQLFADFELESEAINFDQFDILVLPYHPEYFSSSMYRRLRKLVLKEGKSLLYIGGNGIYWKAKWNDNHTAMTCNKSFPGLSWVPFFSGGQWRWSMWPEQSFLGVHYSIPGYKSHAPYRLVSPSNRLSPEVTNHAGELFGMHSLDGKPISGIETDKLGWFSPKHLVHVARGINPAAKKKLYPDRSVEWNGRGGADIIYYSPDGSNGVLSLGSIHSGAGLGRDRIFTTMIEAFINRHSGSAKGSSSNPR